MRYEPLYVSLYLCVYQASCGSCTFESNSTLDPNCGYVDMSTGIFQWDNVQATAEPGADVKPPVDHTTNSSSGHYMLVDHTDNFYGETALLLGPQMGRTTEMCTLSVWFYMTGERSQQLAIYSLVSVDASSYTINLSLHRNLKRTQSRYLSMILTLRMRPGGPMEQH